jgi:hypothetical protein
MTIVIKKNDHYQQLWKIVLLTIHIQENLNLLWKKAV